MKKLPILLFIFVILGIVCWFVFLLTRVNLQILNPQGVIAAEERDLIVSAMIVMLTLAIPVMLIAFFVAWKYREGNKKSSHMPDLVGTRAEIISFWALLGSLVLIFFVFVWIGAHRLDPYKPIPGTRPLTIQVVALQWKWLFIYPQEGIATINFIQIPVDTPVSFRLTADAPMNSFWIPSLSGQIYAMTTMETQLHLMANKLGDFPGGAAEINGKGFSGMGFITRVSSQEDFDTWIEEVQNSSNYLDKPIYNKLARPSENTPVTFYSSVESGLFNSIIMKYMVPSPGPGFENSGEMNMEEISK